MHLLAYKEKKVDESDSAKIKYVEMPCQLLGFQPDVEAVLQARNGAGLLRVLGKKR